MEKKLFDRLEHDRTNVDILQYIRFHPDAKVGEIAQNIGLSRAAAQKRITKLKKGRRLRRAYTTDLDALNFLYRYRVDLKIDPVALKNNAELNQLKLSTRNAQLRLAFYLMNVMKIRNQERAKSIIIEDVSIVLGDPADLCATVRTNDPTHMLEFVTQDLREIDGIANTSTCYEAWTYSRDKVFQEESFRRRGRPSRRKPEVQEHSTVVTATVSG